MKYLGKWWNSPDKEIYYIEGKRLVLNNWNGEIYYECFEVAKNLIDIVGNKKYDVKPIYYFETEKINLDSLEENSEDWEKAIEIVDYKII